MFHVPENYRLLKGPLASDKRYGNNGAFVINNVGIFVNTIASDGEGWERVSVSIPNRVATWTEMCFIKKLFWDEEDAVIQIHPPKKDYVNCHPYTLHLWRKCGTNDFYDKPPAWMVGPKK